jgi:A/G-specific adenine glycosylase
MLQQTTVATVARRFESFIERFPDVASLARASEQEVLKAWEGLGYYRRARNLHRAARILVENQQFDISDDLNMFASLPGVGRYIAGAVLSQSFDRRLPIVEANTKRVLCRLFGQTADPDSSIGQNWLWETAAAILPRKRVGEFNQAMMELGALVCTPRRPDCPQCPLKSNCVAFKDGLQEVLPIRPQRESITEIHETCIVFRRRGRVLLMQRPANGRWASMWEFPRIVHEAEESSDSAAQRLMASLNIHANLRRPELMTIRYSVTRFRMTMRCREGEARDASFQSDYYKCGRWVRLGELAQYPVSSPQRRLASALQNMPKT